MFRAAISQRPCASWAIGFTRQTGSHVRLTTRQDGEHHVTVPNHAQLRIGTLMECWPPWHGITV
jgi:hypothetical protein